MADVGFYQEAEVPGLEFKQNRYNKHPSLPQQSTNTVSRTTTMITVPKAMFAPILMSANCVREHTNANYSLHLKQAQKISSSNTTNNFKKTVASTK